jgi:hypothetical protein
MNPVVANIPVPTMFEITSAVAPTNPICRNNPGRDVFSVETAMETYAHSTSPQAANGEGEVKPGMGGRPKNAPKNRGMAG